MKWKVFTLVLFGNLWIWRILNLNILIGLLTIASSILLYIFLTQRNKNKKILVSIVFLVLVFTQINTTDKQSLVLLSNNEQYVQQIRLSAYPPVRITIFNKTLWIPAGHWLEGRNESIAFFRIQNNFFENIDPNLYFFANHPRERVGFGEFEKFPYILFPIMVIGLFWIIKSKKYFFLFLSFFIPLLILSIIGNKNSLGPFILFPFICCTIARGVNDVFKNTKMLSKRKRKILIGSSLFFYLLVLIQMIAYVQK